MAEEGQSTVIVTAVPLRSRFGCGNMGRPREVGLRAMGWKLPQIQAATIFSLIAIAISGASLIYSKRSYDLSAARDEREMMDKLPGVDVQVRPDGATSAALTISIANRGDINMVPLDITAAHSFEAGELYISSGKQSADRLKTSLSLTSMGTIAPKGVGSLRARLFGATDGKMIGLRRG
jgi:hypothetical protein